MWCFRSSKAGAGRELGMGLDIVEEKFSVVSLQSSVKKEKADPSTPLGMTDRKSEERSQEWLRYFFFSGFVSTNPETSADRIVDQVGRSVKRGKDDQRGIRGSGPSRKTLGVNEWRAGNPRYK